jgi:hypothetical protein
MNRRSNLKGIEIFIHSDVAGFALKLPELCKSPGGRGDSGIAPTKRKANHWVVAYRNLFAKSRGEWKWPHSGNDK